MDYTTPGARASILNLWSAERRLGLVVPAADVYALDGADDAALSSLLSSSAARLKAHHAAYNDGARSFAALLAVSEAKPLQEVPAKPEQGLVYYQQSFAPLAGAQNVVDEVPAPAPAPRVRLSPADDALLHIRRRLERGRALADDARQLERNKRLKRWEAQQNASPVLPRPSRPYVAVVGGPPGPDGKPRGGAIDSAAARLSRCYRRVHAWAKAIPDELEVTKRGKVSVETPRLVMLTLTYRDGNDWRVNHIRTVMLELKKVLKSRLVGYAWVLEMQERGAPHYHVLLYVRRGTKVPEPDTSGIWVFGHSRIETAKTPFYIVMYAGKEYQKNGLPAGARMFAVWVNKKYLSGPLAHLMFRVSSLPAWFREIVSEYVGDDVSRAASASWGRSPGGGWLLRSTGEVFPSPWSLLELAPVIQGDGTYGS